jgi:hypothetical protein
MSDSLIIRVTVEGRASRRWRGAHSQAEADKLNQALSEARAQNLRKPVEDILRQKLPGIKIEVPGIGLGSHHGFPLTGEDNELIDRSVVVKIDLETSHAGLRTEFRPAKLYVPSKFWVLKVVSMVSGSVALQATFMRVKVQNPFTKYEITLAGGLYGGHFTPSGGVGFGHDKPDFNHQVGDEVTFETDDAEDFDFWVGPEKGQWVRVVHTEVGAVRKRAASFLQFTRLDTHPGSLVFEYKKGWSLPKVDISVVSGFLSVEGPVPSDFIDDTKMVTVPTLNVRHNYDGLLVSFPTGKAGWNDLTPKDRERITNFVTNKALNIDALSKSGLRVVAPSP